MSNSKRPSKKTFTLLEAKVNRSDFREVSIPQCKKFLNAFLSPGRHGAIAGIGAFRITAKGIQVVRFPKAMADRMMLPTRKAGRPTAHIVITDSPCAVSIVGPYGANYRKPSNDNRLIQDTMSGLITFGLSAKSPLFIPTAISGLPTLSPV